QTCALPILRGGRDVALPLHPEADHRAVPRRLPRDVPHPRPHPRARPRPPLREGVRERRGRARQARTARGGPVLPAGSAGVAGARTKPPSRAGKLVTVATAPPTGDAGLIELAERFRADLPVAVRPEIGRAHVWT